MEMKQMVYVVIENGYVTGVWNQYQDAASHCGEDGNIIPAVVDTYGERAGCETPEEVIESMEQELQNMYSSCLASDDEDEDEDNPFAHAPYDDTLYNGEEVEYQDEDEEEEEEDELTDSDIICGLLDMLYD